MSRGPRLEDRLRDAAAPGEPEARARAWDVARAALADRPARRPRRRALRAAVPALAAVALATVVVTPPGDAVADWVADRVREVVGTEPAPRPARAERLPGGGRLLASSPAGPVVVGDGRPRRLLGHVDQATWSPNGLFVAAARGIELIAVDLRGRRRWSIHAQRRIVHPRWSPSGYRVAYLTGRPGRGGRTLRVVAGDGTGDRVLAAAGPAPPAWRPRHRHQLAYADPAGRVVVRHADTGRVLWRSRPHDPPRQLAWSSDGRRLIALTPSRTYVFSGVAGGLLRHARAPAGTRNVAVAYRHGSYAYALVRRARGESRVILVRSNRLGAARTGERLLVAVPGVVRGLAWSPDARWLAVGAVRGERWLLLRPARDGLAAVRTLSDAAGRFGDGRFVRLEGWCCAP